MVELSLTTSVVTTAFYTTQNIMFLNGLQEVEAPRISRQSAHEGGKIVMRHLWYSFLSEAKSTPWPQRSRKD